MTQLERIAGEHRVAVRRDECGDPIIPGKNGHLYTDEGAVYVCFTDDGRKRLFPTKLFKTKRLQVLEGHVIRLKQQGDFEFIAEIRDAPEAIAAALFRVLHVRRFMITKGIPREVPAFAVANARRNRAKAE
jgi:hypothetical protein